MPKIPLYTIALRYYDDYCYSILARLTGIRKFIKHLQNYAEGPKGFKCELLKKFILDQKLS